MGLVRKHEWENTTKKAPNRSWDKVCVILRGTQIRFYKDIKAYKTSPDATYGGEVPIDVVGATAEIASDYKKEPHVFRLKLANCGEYLFQASSDEEQEGHKHCRSKDVKMNLRNVHFLL